MPAERLVTDPADPADVLAWREQVLLDASGNLDVAQTLAAAPHVDLHAAVALLAALRERGKDVNLAVQIML